MSVTDYMANCQMKNQSLTNYCLGMAGKHLENAEELNCDKQFQRGA